MNPNNYMRHDAIKHTWLSDYDGSNGPKSAKAFLKRECRKAVRRDERKDIKEQMEGRES